MPDLFEADWEEVSASPQRPAMPPNYQADGDPRHKSGAVDFILEEYYDSCYDPISGVAANACICSLLSAVVLLLELHGTTLHARKRPLWELS